MSFIAIVIVIIKSITIVSSTDATVGSDAHFSVRSWPAT